MSDMQVTRKQFIAGSSLFGVATAMRLNAAGSATPTFRPEDCAEFRRGLRAFYPDECHGKCKDPRQVASVKAIGDELDAFVAAHPGYDVLDVRRELYLSIRRHFIPYILPGSPFYFEAGVNGGWCVWRGAESVPGQHARRVCLRFLRDRHLIPQEAWDVQLARARERFLNVAFGDDTHHIPPFRTIFTKGFGGVRREVADALAKCPADDPRGRKMLETALVGLDTVHFIQLRFADEARRQMAAEGLPEEDRRRLQRPADSAMRCHGEPPRTYLLAQELGLDLIDCTCPVVLQLQSRIREAYGRIHAAGGQIVIFGKVGHAEVLGLVGQVDGDALVVESLPMLEEAFAEGRVCLTGPVEVFSQTTKSPSEYAQICRVLKERLAGPVTVHDTICRQVSSRHDQLRAFARDHDVILFVSGRESSNGKVLYGLCRGENERTHHVVGPEEIRPEWLREGDRVGVCGATSTPKWLLEAVAQKILHL